MSQDGGATEVYPRAEVDAYLVELHQYIATLNSQIAGIKAEPNGRHRGEVVDRSEWAAGSPLAEAHDIALRTVADFTVQIQDTIAEARTVAESIVRRARSTADSILAAARAEAAQLTNEARERAAKGGVPHPTDDPSAPPPPVRRSAGHDRRDAQLTQRESRLSESAGRKFEVSGADEPLPTTPSVHRRAVPTTSGSRATDSPWWANAVVTWPPSMPAPVPWARSGEVLSGPWVETPFAIAARPATIADEPLDDVSGEARSSWGESDPLSPAVEPVIPDEDWAAPSGPMLAPPTGPLAVVTTEMEPAWADTNIAPKRRRFNFRK